MKTSIRITTTICFLFLTLSIQGQSSKWFVQVGGGYLALNQIEQLGFNSKGPAILAVVEVGKTFQPISIGIQQTFSQEYVFYRYSIKQQNQTIYAKYSLNHLNDLLPYGIDPYLMAGATFTTNQFLTLETEEPNSQRLEG